MEVCQYVLLPFCVLIDGMREILQFQKFCKTGARMTSFSETFPTPLHNFLIEVASCCLPWPHSLQEQHADQNEKHKKKNKKRPKKNKTTSARTPNATRRPRRQNQIKKKKHKCKNKIQKTRKINVSEGQACMFESYLGSSCLD